MNHDRTSERESANSDRGHHQQYHQYRHIHSPLHRDFHREHIPATGTGTGTGTGTEGPSIAHTGPNSSTLNQLSIVPPSTYSSRTATPTTGGTQPARDNMFPVPSNPTNSNPLHAQRPRACDSCRGLKVRCQPTDESNPYITYITCKRCAKASRECIFTPPSRKMQKKTDTRVDELEKKINALTATLQAAGTRKAGSTTPSSMGGGDEGEEEENGEKSRGSVEAPRAVTGRSMSGTGNLGGEGLVQARGVGSQPPRKRSRGQYDEDVTFSDRRSPTQTGPPNRTIGTTVAPTSVEPKDSRSTAPKSVQAGPREDIPDVVDRGLLTMEQATHIFHRYIRQMAPLFPIVVFPPGTTAEEIRKTRPTVFLAILAIASGTAAQDLHTRLNHEIIDVLAERVMCKGEKSLEMIHSLLLVSAWFYAPNQEGGLRFVQLVHMAAVMTMDLGINSRNGHIRSIHSGLGSLKEERVPRTILESLMQERTTHENTRHPDSGAIESRRTLLACYYCCSGIALSFRRQNIFRFTSYMADCIEVLETSKDALPSDRVLAQWCKVQRIADEISVTFLFDDPGANVSIQDIRVQCALKGFKRQLEQLSESAFEPGKFFQEGNSLGRALKMAYHHTVLNAHEIGLHVNHNADDSGPPYEKMIRAPPAITAIHVDLLSWCVTSAHAILDIFYTFSIEEIRAMPTFIYARAVYAVVILMKLYFSAAAPKSELGHVLDKDSLLVDRYINTLARKLEEAAAGGMSRCAEMFGRILKLLQSWWEAERVGMKGEGKAQGEDRAKRHKGESHGAGVLGGKPSANPDRTSVGRPNSEPPCTPDIAETSLRLPPLQFTTPTPASEAPNTPPDSSSSAPSPSTEGGGYGASTPLSTTVGLRQIRSLPSLHPPHPAPYRASTPLQILSDVASNSREPGVPMSGKEMYPPGPGSMGQVSPSGKHPPPLPLDAHHPVMYPYPPRPRQQSAQAETHTLPPLPEQNRHFPVASGSMGNATQFTEGVYASGVSQYGFSSASTTGTSVGVSGRGGGVEGAYVTSGVGLERRPSVPGGQGYPQGIDLGHADVPGGGGPGEVGGMGVGVEWGGAGFMTGDFIWAVMGGLPGSFDGAWVGGGVG